MGRGLWSNSVDYLPVCYTQCTILTVWYVGCYQSAICQLLGFQTTACGYVYNREFTTQPTSHSPGKFKFWIWQLIFSLKCFLWCYQKYFSEYNLCYLHSRCLQSLISKLFVSISLSKKWPWCEACLKLYKSLPPVPPTGLYIQSCFPFNTVGLNVSLYLKF